MRRRQETAAWPFLLVLFCLFVLSVTAPRDWEKIAVERDVVASKGSSQAIARRHQPGDPEREAAAELRFAPGETPQMQGPPARVDRYTNPTRQPGAEEADGQATPARAVSSVRSHEQRRDLASRPQRGTRPLGPSTLEWGDAAGREGRSSAGPWLVSALLVEQLDWLANECEASQWAITVRGLLAELAGLDETAGARAAELLVQLDSLTAEGSAAGGLLDSLAEGPLAVEVRRAQHAVRRRLAPWQLLADDVQRQAAGEKLASPDPQRLSLCLAGISSRTSTEQQGDTWRNYLLLDSLESLARDEAVEADESRRLARRVLDRLSSNQLDADQRQVVESSLLASLRSELEQWAAAPADTPRLVALVEQFERSGLPSDARRLSAQARQAAWLPGESGARTRAWLEENYRNSNLRLCVSAELLNRALPEQAPSERPVRDMILGVPTRGWSTTTTELAVRPIADPHRWRIALEAEGQVSARTTSSTGPATFFTQSEADYRASKLIEVGPQGVQARAAEAQAANRPRLRGVRTDFDGIPLLGPLVESIARARHAEREADVRWATQQKISGRVEGEIDAQMAPRVEQANVLLHERLLDPLNELELGPSVVEMQTSARRWTVRLRVASDEQLAANTPRPRAPGQSLASLQIHQSLWNNLCERLELNGRTFSLPELEEHLAGALEIPADAFKEPKPEELRVTFAAQDAVRARFADGQVELTVSIAELRNQLRTWRNFQVRVCYRAEADGLQAALVRDGTIQLRGAWFGAQPQIALRGMFNRIFSQDRKLVLVGPTIAEHPGLTGLEVVQFEIIDGWIGLAIGPAQEVREARRH